MKTKEVYFREKKNYINTVIDKTENIYSLFTNSQKEFLSQYYEAYTRELFKKIMGSLRLQVSKAKAESLMKLKGEGDWEFAGMRDMGYKGACTCELGHNLRYAYKAINTKTKETLIFGSTCVGDFFDLNSDGVKALIRVKDVMQQELKCLATVMHIGAVQEYSAYELGAVRKGTAFGLSNVGNVYAYIGEEGIRALESNKWHNILTGFLDASIPLPVSLIEMMGGKMELCVFNQIQGCLIIIDRTKLDYLLNTKVRYIQELTCTLKSHFSSLLMGNHTSINPRYISSRQVSDIKSFKAWVETWYTRVQRIEKAEEYYKAKLACTYKQILDMKLESNLSSEQKDAFDLLCVFDTDATLDSRYTEERGNLPYRVYGYVFSNKMIEHFDDIFKIVSKTSTLNAIMQLANKVVEAQNMYKARPEQKMLDYLRDNLTNTQYSDIRGVLIAIDIVKNKEIPFEYWSERQKKLVEHVYESMLDKDKEGELIEKPLSDNPEAEIEVYRLRIEGTPTLKEQDLNMLENVLKKGTVNAVELRYISDLYKKYILGEEVATLETDAIYSKSVLMKKEKISDDLRVKLDFLENIKTSLPEYLQGILDNVEKYKTVTIKQKECIEKEYKKRNS